MALASVSVPLPVASAGQNPIIYSVSGLPAWLTYNSAMHRLTGIAPDAYSNPMPVLTATDNDGDTESITINILIRQPITFEDWIAPTYTATRAAGVSVDLPAASGGTCQEDIHTASSKQPRQAGRCKRPDFPDA